jgi:hypothetical protein
MPQLRQNLLCEEFETPQQAQSTSNAAPHCVQNRLVSRLSVWQLAHFMKHYGACGRRDVNRLSAWESRLVFLRAFAHVQASYNPAVS